MLCMKNIFMRSSVHHFFAFAPPGEPAGAHIGGAETRWGFEEGYCKTFPRHVDLCGSSCPHVCGKGLSLSRCADKDIASRFRRPKLPQNGRRTPVPSAVSLEGCFAEISTRRELHECRDRSFAVEKASFLSGVCILRVHLRNRTCAFARISTAAMLCILCDPSSRRLSGAV